jgi:acetolactate synthase-1/2/3 large subunit
MNCANQAVGAADLVIFLGTNTNDQLTMSWQIPAFATKTIQIDIDPAEIGKNYPNCIGLCGDAKVVVGQLIEKVAKTTRPEWRKEVAAYVADTYAAVEQYVKSDAAPIRPERLCAEISKALPDDGVLVTDTGYSAIWGGTMVRMKPTQSFIRAAGSLGWGFPGSLGVKCGAGDRAVVCLTGDGGFYYHLNEMETAARCGINSVTVVNNNQMLSQCREGLSYLWAGRIEEGMKSISFSDLNLAEIAEKFGCLGIRVTKPEDIGPAIQKGLASGKPTIVEVMTDPYAEPQVAFVPK